MTSPQDAPFGHPSTWPQPAAAEPAAPAAPEQLPPPLQPLKKPKTPLWFLLTVVPAVLIGGGAGIYYENRPSAPVTPAEADESRQAERVCHGYIEQRLKAPATARYPTPDISKDGPDYTVTGEVDSQNSFGALIRTNYRCMVSSEGGGKWTLEHLDFPYS